MTRTAGLAATARIARRQARRAPWRSVLIVALVALPIAGLSVAAVAIRTAFATTEERVRSQIGAADLVLFPPSSREKRDELLATLPAGSSVVTRSSRYGMGILDGRQVSESVIELSSSSDRSPAQGLFHVVEGRAPGAPGEAALEPSVLRAIGGDVGGDVTIPLLGRTVHVTGTVVLPENVSDPIALLGPGTFAAAGVPQNLESYLVDLPSSVSVPATAQSIQASFGAEAVTRATVEATLPFGRTIATGIAFAAGAMALFGTGLIAAAAFSVGARRQLRTLGLVGALGGEPRHLRQIVLLSGTVLGLAGSIVGVIVGIAVVLPARPLLGRLADRVVDPVRVPVLPLLAAVALGTLASTAAAFAPARAAAKLSPVEALAARTRPPRPPGRIAAAGLILVAIGAGILAWSARAHSDLGPPPARSRCSPGS